MAPLARVPRIPWQTLQVKLAREWLPGGHVTLVGPTRSGKTTIALHLAEMTPLILVLATKRRDPLVEELARKGYLITDNLEDIKWVFRDQASRRKIPVRPRIVFWPRLPDKLDASEQMAILAPKFRQAMSWANETMHWTVVIDETMFLADKLRLQDDLDFLWFQGRTQEVSVIANAQRPARVPRLAFSSADYVFLAQTSDKQDIERLRDISAGIPKEVIDDTIRQLDFNAHEFLFIDVREKGLARVIAPPR